MIVFYAGFDNTDTVDKLIRILENGYKMEGGILLSYLNMSKGMIDRLNKLREFGVPIMLDSGAHSLTFAWLKEKGETIEMGHTVSAKALDIIRGNKFDEYVDSMFEFVNKNRDVFDIVVELDIQSIVGIEKVYEWRKKFSDAGIELMYVWHGEDFEEVKKWLDETIFIGLGGTSGEREYEKRLSMARRIKRYNDSVWLHWFAFTNYEMIRKVARQKLISSADSSTWSTGSRFGTFYTKQGNYIVLTDASYHKAKILREMRLHSKEFEKYGVNMKEAMKLGTSTEGDFYNLLIADKLLKEINEDIEKSVQVKGFTCRVCAIADRCAYYDEDAEECYVVKHRLKNVLKDDEFLTNTIRFVLNQKVERYVRAKYFEDLEGGVIDRQVSSLEDSIVKLIDMYLKIKYPERYVKGYSSSVGEGLDKDIEKILKVIAEGEEDE